MSGWAASDNFNGILAAARAIAAKPDAVPALLAAARMVGREFATTFAVREFSNARSNGVPMRDWIRLVQKFRIPQEKTSEQIWLGWDAVVARPWSQGSFTSTLRKLSTGPGDVAQPWRFDRLNHKVCLWLPMRLAEVWNGNHSIFAGTLSGTGVLPAVATYDFAPLFSRLSEPHAWGDDKSNGVWWEDLGDGEIVQVFDWRLGLLFEIGRLLHEHDFDGRIGQWNPFLDRP